MARYAEVIAFHGGLEPSGSGPHGLHPRHGKRGAPCRAPANGAGEGGGKLARRAGRGRTALVREVGASGWSRVLRRHARRAPLRLASGELSALSAHKSTLACSVSGYVPLPRASVELDNHWLSK